MKKERRNKPKLIAIHLDAAEPSLIYKWADEGVLPTLATLLRDGSTRVLQSTSDISSGATWASLNTSVNPARHGMGFTHRQIKSGTYEIRKKYADEIGRRPFWESFPVGVKRLLFDVPTTEIREGGDDIHVIGWGEEGLSAKMGSHPKSLFKEIKKKFGPHPLHGWYQARPKSVSGWKKLRNDIINGANIRTDIFTWMLKKYSWDFAAVTFAETHWAGHLFWHLVDEDHPEHDENVRAQLGDPIKDVYISVDKAISRVIREFPEASVCIFSNTGMGPNYSGQHLLPKILERLNLGKEEADKKVRKRVFSSLLPGRKWGPAAVKRIEELVGVRNIEFVRRIIPEKFWDRWTRRFLTAGNDWHDMRTFSLPTDFTGGIRINLIGREPQGKVRPGKEYEELCQKIVKSFKKLINVKTGRSAVDEVFLISELCHGEFLHEFPDVIVRWNRDASIECVSSEDIGEVCESLPDKRSGAHTVGGFFVLRGEGIRPGKKFSDAHIVDIGPTFVKFFGGTLEDVDGRVMKDIFC